MEVRGCDLYGRERKTHRLRDRQTHRLRDRQTQRLRDRQKDTQTHRLRDRQTQGPNKSKMPGQLRVSVHAQTYIQTQITEIGI